jgi:formylglycine-generating enzyme required for sulfatase activity
MAEAGLSNGSKLRYSLPVSPLPIMHLLKLSLILLTFLSAAFAERRALVIGNAAYTTLQRLDACTVDAASMVESFRAIGVSIHGNQAYTNLSADRIDALLHEFSATLGSQDEAFVYYSGHGMETDGVNYLLPVEFNAEYTSQVKRQAVALSDVLNLLEGTQASLRVVILDACRDPGTLLPGEPAAKTAGFRAKGLGEIKVEAPETLVWYATKHGTVSLAPLSAGKNSIFTGILAREIRQPGTFEELLRRVAAEVYGATNKRQLPFAYGSLLNEHRFVAGNAPNPPPSPPLTLADRVRATTKDAPFVNSLGLEFIPLPGKPGVLLCRTETRVRDFRAFASASNYRQTGGAYVYKVNKTAEGGDKTSWELDSSASWENPGFSQTGDHPVVCVSWDEANAFCAWLSAQVAEKGLAYRLPTDAEWSLAVGSVGKYPWGNDLSKVSGNYFDQSLIKTLPKANWKEITPGYNDGAERTATVASYQENRFGFYDLGGNVFEWCQDWYRDSMNDADVVADFKKRGFDDGGGNQCRVLRGGSWLNYTEVDLRSSYRNGDTPTGRYDYLGFRVVLELGSGG